MSDYICHVCDCVRFSWLTRDTPEGENGMARCSLCAEVMCSTCGEEYMGVRRCLPGDCEPCYGTEAWMRGVN